MLDTIPAHGWGMQTAGRGDRQLPRPDTLALSLYPVAARRLMRANFRGATMGGTSRARVGRAVMTESAMRRKSQSRIARRPASLLTRVTLVNVAVLLTAGAALIVTPATVSDPVVLEEITELVGGAAVLVIANLFLLRRAFAPLHRLTETMGRVDHLRPGLRIPAYGGGEEIANLTRAFNDMLDRLEAERRSNWQRTAEAQESERRTVARELHDEVGQSLTALKLLLARAGRGSGADRDDAIAEANAIADETLTNVREIARRLRPEALDELGLRNALAALAKRVAAHGHIRVERRLDPSLPELERSAELVVYRVAQESLTNVLRHSHAETAVIALAARDGEVELVVSDDGLGMGDAAAGDGIKGMTERALGAGGHLELSASSLGGTDVRLTIPLEVAHAR
jgi:two-component system sensor histidine kinase UhpB